MRTERDLEESDAQIEALEAEVARLRRLQSARGRAHPRTVHRENRARLTRTSEMTPSDRDTNSVSNDVFLAEDPNEPISPELHSSENVILPRPIHESNLRFQVPDLGFGTLLQKAKFFRVMSETPAWRTLATAFHTLKTWMQRTVWGDRVCHFLSRQST